MIAEDKMFPEAYTWGEQRREGKVNNPNLLAKYFRVFGVYQLVSTQAVFVVFLCVTKGGLLTPVSLRAHDVQTWRARASLFFHRSRSAWA